MNTTDRVYQQDCIEGLCVIEDKSIDLLLSDPPFGMNFRSNRRSIKHKRIENDDNLDWLPFWMKEINRVMKDDSHLYIFCSHHNIEIFKYEVKKYRNIKNILIWEKNNHGSGDLEGDYAPQYEMILFCSNGKKKLNGGRSSNIIKANKTGNKYHGTEKPIDLMEFFIGKSSIEGDTVLDTFAGGGSTLIAAKGMCRKYIGFEIDKDNYKTINERLDATQLNLLCAAPVIKVEQTNLF